MTQEIEKMNQIADDSELITEAADRSKDAVGLLLSLFTDWRFIRSCLSVAYKFCRQRGKMKIMHWITTGDLIHEKMQGK